MPESVTLAELHIIGTTGAQIVLARGNLGFCTFLDEEIRHDELIDAAVLYQKDDRETQST